MPASPQDDSPFGVGTVHQRVKHWYTGTIDLGITSRQYDGGEGLFRRTENRDPAFNPNFYNNPKPWYMAHEESNGAGFNYNLANPDVNAPWEGIGEGWFYSVLGGGVARRPTAIDPKVSVGWDNTETVKGDMAVSTVFNGNFDASYQPLLGRFPVAVSSTPGSLLAPSWAEMPGWSFHNGNGAELFQGFYLEDTGSGNKALRLGGLPEYPNNFHALALPVPLPTDPLLSIEHNRQYVIDGAAYLTFLGRIEKIGAGDVLRAVYKPATGGSIVLGTVDLSTGTTGVFKDYQFALQPGVANTVGSLEFDLLDAAGNPVEAEFWLDEVSFLPVTITETNVALPLITGQTGFFFDPAAGTSQPFTFTSNGTERTITIDFEGPIEDFMKKSAGSIELQDTTFVMAASGSATITLSAEAKTYDELFAALANKFVDVNRDQLYGSQITVSELTRSPTGTAHIDRTNYLLYRWVDVVDATQALARTGDTAVFLNTFNDDTGGFSREKLVDVHLPDLDLARTTFDGLNTVEFSYADPTVETGPVTWTFDPQLASNAYTVTTGQVIHKTDTLTLKVQNGAGTIDVGTIKVSGRATAATTLDVNMDGYKAELRRMLTDGSIFQNAAGTWIYSYTGAGFSNLGANFVSTFNGFLPGQAYTAAQFNAFLDAQAIDMFIAVSGDYDPANVDATGFIVVDDRTADVKMTWLDLGSGLFGEADYDADEAYIKPLAGTNVKISDAAKQWAVAEGINQKVLNKGKFAVGINLQWNPAPAPHANATFAQYVANTVSHEIAHTFGLNDAYFKGPPQANVDPNDIMRGGRANNDDWDLEFSARNVELLKAAMGLSASVDRPFTAALRMYQTNFGLPNSQVGIRDVIDNPDVFVPEVLGWLPDFAAGDPGALPPVPPIPGFPPVVGTFDPIAGWSVRGDAVLDDGLITLSETTGANSGVAQAFLVPTGAIALAFDLVGYDFDAIGNGPEDAFEAALLDPTTLAPIVGTISLSRSDALFNLQADGRFYTDNDVKLAGLAGAVLPTSSDTPITVTIDLAGINAGRAIALYFDLLGFGALGSRVSIDNVRFVTSTENPPPNVAPVVPVIPSKTVAEGSTLSFNVDRHRCEHRRRADLQPDRRACRRGDRREHRGVLLDAGRRQRDLRVRRPRVRRPALHRPVDQCDGQQRRAAGDHRRRRDGRGGHAVRARAVGDRSGRRHRVAMGDQLG